MSYFKCIARHWRWCGHERTEPHAADVRRRWQNCGDTIFRTCLDGGGHCATAARKIGAHNITKMIKEIVTGFKSLDSLEQAGLDEEVQARISDYCLVMLKI